MSTQEMHRDIVAGLASRGLPLEYAERVAAELSDHHCDLIEELTTAGMDESTAHQEADNRLGDQKTLIKKSVREYQRRHWCGRWPLLTFLFGPVVLLALGWILMSFLIAGIGIFREAVGIEPMPPLGTDNMEKYVVCMLCKTWAVFLCPAIVVYFLARLASRAALSKGWIFLNACILATFVGTFEIGFKQSGNTFGFSLPLEPLFCHSFSELITWYTNDFSQMCQLLLPLAVAAIFLWRTQQQVQRNLLVGA